MRLNRWWPTAWGRVMAEAIAATLVKAGASAGTAKIAADVIVTVAYIAGSVAVSAALAPKPQAPSRLTAVRAPVSARKIHFGQTIAGSDIKYDNAVDQTRWQVLVHNAEPVPESRIISRRVNGTPRSILSNGYLGPTSRFGNEVIAYEYRAGTVGQSASSLMLAPSQLRDKRPAPDWTREHRLDNLAYSVLRCKTTRPENFSETYINGAPPGIALEARFGTMTDFRTGQTGYVDNPASIIAMFLTHRFGNRLPTERIDVASFAKAMDDCDRLGLGLAGFWGADQAPKDTLSNMLLAIDGAIWLDNRGRARLLVGDWMSDPDVTINADHILSIPSLQAGADDGQLVTETVVEYIDRSLDYRPVELTAAREASGEYAVSKFDISFIPFATQAARVGRRLHTRANAEWRGELILNMAGMRLRNRRFFVLDLPSVGIEKRVVELDKWRFNIASGQVQVSFRTVDETDFQPTPPGPLPAYEPLLGNIALD